MKKVTDEEIYHYLLGPFVVNAMYVAPAELRPNDTNASFGVYEKNGKLLWHDFGMDYGVDGNKAVNLVMAMRGVNYAKAMRIIETEIAQSRIGKPPVKLKKSLLRGELPFIKHRTAYTEWELEYWQDYGVDEEQLVYENVYALESMKYPNSKVTITSRPNDPAFVYLYNKNPYQCKVYRPLNPDYKFRMYNMDNIIEGWAQMVQEYKNLQEPFKRLYINASTKDRLVWKNVLDYDESAINPPSEGIFYQLIRKKDDINLVSSDVCIIFDPDDTGYNKSKDLAEQTGWNFIDMREITPGEDIALFRKNHGAEKLRQLKKDLFIV